MNRFCFFTDSQCTSHTVSSRKDIYEDAILNKMAELVNASNELGCDIYCGGDFVDSPYLGHSFIVKLIDILRNLRNKLYIVLGNHDILGRNLDSYKYTTIGILEKAEVLTVVKDEIRVFGNYTLRANPYNENDEVKNYIFSEPTILISHNMVVPFIAPYTHIHTDKIIESARNLILLCGHYHPPFEVKNQSNNVIIINPGSTGRVSRGDGQNRIPNYLIVTIDGMSAQIDRVEYKCAKPWNEVFHAIEDGDIGVVAIKNGIDALSIDGLSMVEIIKKYGQSINSQPTIVDECVRRVEVIERAINDQKLKYGQ